MKHEQISLKSHPDFNEVWLHHRICEDTTILGLGDLTLVEKERVQMGGGRLDLLLADVGEERTVWYEVELMLGPTDPSHIIRTIEYWDNERRRYPAYDHIAVLVAEQVTARFLNVIGLFAGSIPIIAIQLNALKVGDHILLDFVKILDQRQLRAEPEDETEDGDADRSTWEARVGAPLMKICDRVSEIANEIAEPKLALKYKKGRVALSVPGSFFNVLSFYPKKSFIRMRLRATDAETRVAELAAAGLDADLKDGTRVVIRLSTAGEIDQHQDLLRRLIHQAVKENGEG